MANGPTEIRLHPGMAEDFKCNVMVATDAFATLGRPTATV